MAETAIPNPTQKKNRLIDSLRQNPVMLKELRGRMRGRRAFVLMTIYIFALVLVIGLAYAFYATSVNFVPMTGTNSRQVFGKTLFGLVMGMELLSITFIAPALTAGAISGERERLTFDLVRTTLLPAGALVRGKFTSALVFLLLLLFAALPLQSIAFLFGGIAPEEVLIGTLLLVVTAVSFSAAGLFISSFMKNTLGSTVLSYAFAILLVFGLPLLVLTFLGLVSSALGVALMNDQISEAAMLVLATGIYFLISINPAATMVATELLLVEEQELFLYHLPMNNGQTFPVISPWISYTIIYLTLSLVLLWLSIAFVRRIEQ